MRKVSTTIRSDDYVGNLITDELLAINMRSHHNRTDPGSDFRQTLEQLDTNSIRFPGGTVTEEHFDPSDPNATRVENAVQIIHPHLIPERSDVPIVRTVTPLSDYLSLVNELGGKPVVVLPTYRYFDQSTRTLTAGAEEEIRKFVRELMTDHYGNVDELTLEIGNEFYQPRFNWNQEEFGRFQAKIAELIDDEVSSLGLRDDLTLLAQAGKSYLQNLSLASKFPGGEDATVDGIILHFYGTSGAGNPLAMGQNISAHLSNVKIAWARLGADFEIAVTEWNVGEDGEANTVVNGIMRSAPLLFMFAEMVKGGVDTSMIWAARTDGPAGLSVREDPGSVLSPTGYFYKMLTESVNGLNLVAPGNAYLRDAFGQHVGYTYTFEGETRSVTYFASAVGQSIELSADMSAQIRDGAYIFARTLGVAPGDEVTDYWSDGALTYNTDVQLKEVNGRFYFDVDINPYELVELHVVYDQGIEVRGDSDDEIADLLTGSAFADHLEGEGGADRLYGKEGDDRLDGGMGADVLRGNQGEDSLFGGAGHDRLLGGEDADHLFGGREKDRLFGQNGDDHLRGEQAQDELFGDLGNDVLLGGLGIDSLFGGADNDQLFGGVGADHLDGGDGDDALTGMLGGDVMYGGAGDDQLAGNNGNDDLFGGDGDDTLEGGRMRDTLTGGEGADNFVFSAGAGKDVITDFEDGVDAISFMIQSFGYEDLRILQDGEDALVRHAGGQIRITEVDASILDSTDFTFGPLT
ncbi:MAG: calcium-binding protein [Pseudomonadota bacterium]